jgi:hypothetical protein
MMAADGVASVNDRVERSSSKLWRHRDCIVGCSGTKKHWDLFHQWIATGRQGARPRGDYEALLLYRDGRITMFETGAKFEETIVETYYSIGSGSDFAFASFDTLEAMGLPPDPRIAVDVACRRDAKSGAPVQSMRWKPTK